MKRSSFFYLFVLIFGLLIPTQQSSAFFFDFDFSGSSDYYGWDYYDWDYYGSDYPYYYSRSYSRNRPYYMNRYNRGWNRWSQPYQSRWGQPYQNRWGEPSWNRCVGPSDEQQTLGSVNDSGLSTPVASDIK